MGAALGVLLTAAAGVYVCWFYGYAFPAVSPDMASAGLSANWYQCVGAILLIMTVCGAGARRLVKYAEFATPPERVRIGQLPIATESWPVLILLLSVFANFVILTFWAILSPNSTTRWTEWLPYLLIDPDAAFMTALGIFSFRLSLLRWKGRLPREAVFMRIPPRRFATTYITMLMLMTIAIPALAAFSFSFWLGPWYRW